MINGSLRSSSHADNLKRPKLGATIMAIQGQVHTMLGAIHEKYDPSDSGDLDCVIYVPKSAPGKTESGNIRVPHQLTLNRYDISMCGDKEELSKLCGDVTELDLAQNSISDWSQVLEILWTLPKLKFLNLSHNPLHDYKDELNSGQDLPSINHLILNGCHLQWSCIDGLLAKFKELEELHLSLNQFDKVDLQHEIHQNVKTLHFNANPIKEWEEICKLGNSFPNLKKLVITENMLNNFDPSETIATSFPVLERLCMSKIELSEWKQLDKLRLFPCLKDIRLLGIPLLKQYSDKEGRRFIIARLPNILQLNGSKVSEAEREEAERAFIRHYLDVDEKPDRYYELEKIHGKLEPLVNINLKPQTTVNLLVKCGDKSEIQEIALDLTSMQLKKRYAKKFKVPLSRVLMHYQDHEGVYSSEVMSSSRKLYGYNFRSGNTLKVDIKPELINVRSYLRKRSGKLRGNNK